MDSGLYMMKRETARDVYQEIERDIYKEGLLNNQDKTSVITLKLCLYPEVQQEHQPISA